MGKYSMKEKYGMDTYGYAVGLNFLRFTEKMLDKDVAKKWSLTYQFSTNYERDEKTYYSEKTNRYSIGYQFLPFAGIELYYKDKAQCVNLIGTKVNIGLEYVGISVNFRL